MPQSPLAPVALITGAAQGIGFGTAKHLLHQGWRVAITEVDIQAGQQSLQALEPFHDAVTFCPCDVSQEGDVKRCIQKDFIELMTHCPCSMWRGESRG